MHLARPLLPGLVVALALAGCLSGLSGPEATPAAEPMPAREDAFTPVGQPSAPVGPAAFGASVRVLATGLEFYEPTIGITKDGTIAVCCPNASGLAGSLLFGNPATFISKDGGSTWVEAHVQPLGSYDPMLAVDPVTDRIYEFNMFQVNCSNLAYSDDSGATWSERPLSCGAAPVFDFLKVAAGRPGPEDNALATGDSVLYQCRNVNQFTAAGGVLSSWCTVSYDGGLTWPVDRPAAVRGAYTAAGGTTVDGCGGVTSWPAVGPDGTAVLPLGNGCLTPTLAVSRDSGLTWSLVRFPGEPGMVSVTPQAAFDDAGHLYLLWQDFEHRMNLARSDDRGATWAGPWNVTPPGARSLVFEALQAGAEGRLAFAFFAGPEESQDGGGISSGVPDDMPWHLFVGTVEGGHTDRPGIALYRASPPDDPVQVGPVCFGGGGCPRNHGDFFSAATAPDGTFYLAFVDGCVGDCVGDAEATDEDSRASEGRLAVLDGFKLR